MAALAGAARREITPPSGVELMGYGARVGVASGVHDPLHARALYLRDEALGGVLVVAAELCLITPEQAGEVREALSEETGLPSAAILVSCTHTHSGPDTGLGAQLSGRPPPGYVQGLLGGIVAAGREAFRARRPAHLGWTRAEARIGRNRRVESGPVDPDVLVLEVREATGAPLAILYSYACHGTVLGHDNLEVSADWSGVTSAQLEAATGAVAPFVLGAHADIDPRTRGLMDPAIEGQSRGLGFDAVRALGSEVAEAIGAALGRGQRLEAQTPIRGASRVLRLPVHLGELEPEQAERELAERKRELARRLGASGAELPSTRALFALARERAAQLPISEARECLAQVRLYVRDRTARMWAGGRRELDVEVQALRIGDAALLALPLEATTEVGLDWKRRARRTVPLAGVAAIGNGWLRYLPHSSDLAHPRAHQHYEVLSTLLAGDPCEALLGAGEALLREVSS